MRNKVHPLLLGLRQLRRTYHKHHLRDNRKLFECLWNSNILDSIRLVFASLYNDRAISYRVHQNFSHADVAISAGIQKMVRSDKAASGVMFTLDTESGFREVVFITSSYGLGETVVQGSVNPDEFYLFKNSLSNGKYPILKKA